MPGVLIVYVMWVASMSIITTQAQQMEKEINKQEQKGDLYED